MPTIFSRWLTARATSSADARSARLQPLLPRAPRKNISTAPTDRSARGLQNPKARRAHRPTRQRSLSRRRPTDEPHPDEDSSPHVITGTLTAVYQRWSEPDDEGRKRRKVASCFGEETSRR